MSRANPSAEVREIGPSGLRPSARPRFKDAAEPQILRARYGDTLRTAEDTRIPREHEFGGATPPGPPPPPPGMLVDVGPWLAVFGLAVISNTACGASVLLKTGMRIANTMEGAVAPYKRLCQRYPDAKGEDYLFLPQYQNRVTAARVFARQFNALLDETGLKIDTTLQTDRTIYSLRHTAICMRIILSEGRVNIFNLAKPAAQRL